VDREFFYATAIELIAAVVVVFGAVFCVLGGTVLAIDWLFRHVSIH
jgi:hypothetical protein